MSQTPDEIQAEITAILEGAAQEIGRLVSLRYNETCECPAQHEVAVSSWAFAYEEISMREGGSPMTQLEVICSPNSHAHAAGMLSTASDIVKLAAMAPHFQ